MTAAKMIAEVERLDKEYSDLCYEHKTADADEVYCRLTIARLVHAVPLAARLKEAAELLRSVPTGHEDYGAKKLRDQGFTAPCCDIHDWLRSNGFTK